VVTGPRSTSAVLDASSFVRAVDPESGDERARAWLEAIAGERLDASVPDVFFLEVTNTFTKLIRAGRLEPQAAEDALGFAHSLELSVIETRDIVWEILAAALDTGLSAYDASYVVVAARADAVLVTADRRLADTASRSALLPWVGPEDVFGDSEGDA